MTPHETIIQIRDAITTGDLSAAEKVLEEYLVCFMRWKADSEWDDYFIHATTEEKKTYEKLYQLFLNEKSLNKQ